MTELLHAPRTIHREILRVARPGADLAMHAWIPDRPSAAVFYFHGLQSHAGWVWEAGSLFAQNGVALFVLDRRGCGISDGVRSEVPSVELILADYRAAIKQAKSVVGQDIPITLFGHCLGGSFMAALMHHRDFTASYAAAVFCSTWLGKLHSTLSPQQRAALAADTSGELWDAGLDPADFSDAAKYLRYMETDDLATRMLTRRSRGTLLELETMYLAPERRALPDVPVAYVAGTTDPVIDLDAAHATFTGVFGTRGTIVSLPTAKHYLFYTDQLVPLVNWASDFAVNSGSHG